MGALVGLGIDAKDTDLHRLGIIPVRLIALTLMAASNMVDAAALERSVPQVVRLLYEKGNYTELGVSWISPHQSGDDAVFATPGGPVAVNGNTGDLLHSFTNLFAAVKGDINEDFSFGLMLDQPQGVDSSYGQGSFPSPALSYRGTEGKLESYQLTGVLDYDINPQFKIYGGLRAEHIDPSAAAPFVGGYTVDVDSDWGGGFLLGAGYVRPDKAQRVAITWLSAIDHDVSARERALPLGETRSRFSMNTPQSVSIDVQTGILPKTLLFGSIRWMDWSEYAIEPPGYAAITAQALVDYQDDWWTYTLGIGRQWDKQLAGSFFIAYEPSVGGPMTTLGPHDGRLVGTAALSYDCGKFNYTGALTYGELGDTYNRLQTDFNDGWIWGATFRLGYSF